MDELKKLKEKYIKEEFLQMKFEIAHDVLDLKELPGDFIINSLEHKKMQRDTLLDIKDPKKRIEMIANRL